MRTLLLTSFLLLFSACSIKNYEHTQSKIFIIKSPAFKFADLGYLRNTGDALELDLFIAGNLVKHIEINRMICVDEGCLSKASFNEEYLYKAYPSDTLQSILLGKPIYGGKNIFKKANGFEQSIKTNEVDIRYRVDSHTIFFKDSKNKIIFKIKETL